MGMGLVCFKALKKMFVYEYCKYICSILLLVLLVFFQFYELYSLLYQRIRLTYLKSISSVLYYKILWNFENKYIRFSIIWHSDMAARIKNKTKLKHAV